MPGILVPQNPFVVCKSESECTLDRVPSCHCSGLHSRKFTIPSHTTTEVSKKKYTIARNFSVEASENICTLAFHLTVGVTEKVIWKAHLYMYKMHLVFGSRHILYSRYFHQLLITVNQLIPCYSFTTSPPRISSRYTLLM